MKPIVLTLAFLATLASPALTIAAEDPVAKGEAIDCEWDCRDDSFGHTRAFLTRFSKSTSMDLHSSAT